MKTDPITKPPCLWHYGQPWLPQTEPGFAPGRVSIACKNDNLLIRAELSDAHVTTDSFPFNFPAFKQCDAFEIFLGPADEMVYYELHVTPSNSVLQLRFDNTEETNPLIEQRVAKPLFSSETSLTPGGWSVVARIPLKGLSLTSHPEWRLSFGRYDYTPGQTKPAISSTSPHAICNFHCREEWRWVRLADLSENFGAVPRFMGVK
ncbi:MAG: hypothetical protein ACOYM3_21755 [Terrimicrobiaceae bacterium]